MIKLNSNRIKKDSEIILLKNINIKKECKNHIKL